MSDTPITKLPDGSAFWTSTVMSKEEAMLLPVSQRPLGYRIPGDLYHAVFDTVGAASMCWKPSPSFEVFDSEEASDVALKLCFKIAEALEAKDTDAFVVQLLERVNELLAENADLQKQLEAKHEELLDAARELQRRSEPDDR